MIRSGLKRCSITGFGIVAAYPRTSWKLTPTVNSFAPFFHFGIPRAQHYLGIYGFGAVWFPPEARLASPN